MPHSAKGSAATGTAFAYTDTTTASAIAAPFAPVVLCVLHPVDHLQH